MKRHIKQWMSLFLVCAMVSAPWMTASASDTKPSDGAEDEMTVEPREASGGETGGSSEGSTPDSTKTQEGSQDKEGDKEQPSGTDDGKAGSSQSTDNSGKKVDSSNTENPSKDSGKSEDGEKKDKGEAAEDNKTNEALNQEGEVTEPITKEDKPYLALGANLTADQQSTVLELLGINPDELGDYDVIYVTNEEEHQYLDAYVSKGKIGTRSLSSVLVVKREEGHGINITTKNISYCTIGMYKNALITAGITDADIIVAGPTPISGTAALVGALKAYSVMTGEEVSEDSIDTALNELVVTGDIADAVGDSEKAEELLAYLKQQIIEEGLDSEEGIRKAIDKACDKFDITLTEDEINQLVSLLKKIGELDLDLDSIISQAQSLYDKLSEMNSGGFFAKIGEFFQAIADFFKGLFGN